MPLQWMNAEVLDDPRGLFAFLLQGNMPISYVINQQCNLFRSRSNATRDQAVSWVTTILGEPAENLSWKKDALVSCHIDWHTLEQHYFFIHERTQTNPWLKYHMTYVRHRKNETNILYYSSLNRNALQFVTAERLVSGLSDKPQETNQRRLLQNKHTVQQAIHNFRINY
jgi:hypothetical protein